MQLLTRCNHRAPAAFCPHGQCTLAVAAVSSWIDDCRSSLCPEAVMGRSEVSPQAHYCFGFLFPFFPSTSSGVPSNFRLFASSSVFPLNVCFHFLSIFRPIFFFPRATFPFLIPLGACFSSYSGHLPQTLLTLFPMQLLRIAEFKVQKRQVTKANDCFDARRGNEFLAVTYDHLEEVSQSTFCWYE